MKFGSFDGGEDDEYNGIDFVEKTRIFAMRGPLFLMAPLDTV